MKQFRLQALVLGALVAVPVQAMNIDINKINPNDFAQVANQVKSKLKDIIPVFDQVIGYVQSGDFTGLRAYLKGQAAVLDLTPAIMLVQKNFGPLKTMLAEAINSIEQQVQSMNLPAEVKSAARTAKENVNLIDTVRENLGTIATYGNLAMVIDKIVDGLQIAANDKTFMKNLSTFRADVMDQYNVLAATDFNVIAAAVPVAMKIAKGQEINIETEGVTLGEGLGQARQAVPALVGVLQGLTVFALRTNKLLMKQNLNMPSVAAKSMETVRDNSRKIYNAVTSLNEKFDAALTQAGF